MNTKNFLKEVFISWLPFAIIITTLTGLIYVSVQQDLRQGANDPQIQIAENIAYSIQGGQLPSAYNSQQKFDFANNLSTFIIIYDNNKNVLASNAQLSGSVPKLPNGVYDYVNKNIEDRFTWEPKNAIRDAVVVRRYTGTNNGYVLVGRSLREIENREDNLLHMTATLWGATLMLTLAAVVIPKKIK